MTVLADLATPIIEGDGARVTALTRQALGAGLPPKVVLDEGLIAGMTVVGDRFRVHEIFLPECLPRRRCTREWTS